MLSPILQFNKEVNNLDKRVADRKSLIAAKNVKKDSPIQVGPRDIYLILNFPELSKKYKHPTPAELKKGNFGTYDGVNLRCS